jgi:hypothetical protein
MNDPRKIVLKALYTAIGTATGRTVYTKIPKQPAPMYPYIYISDVFMEEEGTKLSYQYKFQILIEVCHKDTISDDDIFNDMDDIAQLINNSVPFALESGYSIMDMRLVSSMKTEVLTETGSVDVGAIRIVIRVETT